MTVGGDYCELLEAGTAPCQSVAVTGDIHWHNTDAPIGAKADVRVETERLCHS